MMKVLPPDEAKRRARENVAAWKRDRSKGLDIAKPDPAPRQEKAGMPQAQEKPALPLPRPRGRRWAPPDAALGQELIHAAMVGDLSEVSRLLAKGANIEARDEYGWAPLMRASFRGHMMVAQMLLDNGADAGVRDHEGRTPLMCASYGGSVEVAELLIDKGADIDAKDGNGQTALMWARAMGKSDTARMLRERGAKEGS